MLSPPTDAEVAVDRSAVGCKGFDFQEQLGPFVDFNHLRPDNRHGIQHLAFFEGGNRGVFIIDPQRNGRVRSEGGITSTVG